MRDGSGGTVPSAAMAWVERAAAAHPTGAGVPLDTDVTGDVDVDLGVLRHVLLRLVGAALDRVDGDESARVQVTMRPLGDGLEVLVTDGAATDDPPLVVLARGVTTPHRDDGLATSRALAEQLGGWLAAVPHEPGTRHVLWLPTRDHELVGPRA